MKRILSLVLCLFMVISLAACDSSGDGDKDKNPAGTKVDSSLKKGELSSVGDVFKLPDIKASAGAPVLAEITKQAYPGDSVMVCGEGFKSAGVKFYVYSQTTKDNGKATEAKFTVADDNYASVLIDEKLDYGIYGIYAENASGTSTVKLVNKPQIWDIGLYRLCAGEKLTVLGENLTTDNGDKSSAFLVSEDGKEYCEASIAFADPGKIEIIIPEGLKVGSKYKVKIHNGHGGESGFAESEKTVEILEETAIQFNGKVIDVTKLGADPKSRTNDDSTAVQKAVRQAKKGDIIYFPPGSYLFTSPININTGIKLLGAGADKTTIFAGYNVSGAIFDINAGPCEITGIRFEQNRAKGKLKGNFIDFQADSIESGAYNIYIHGNIFNQSVTAKSRSTNWNISISGTYGALVENNYFDSTGMVSAANCKNVYVRNNEAIMKIYVGVYYQVANNIFTNVAFLDVSNNKITGGGAPEKGSSALKTDEFTAGRVFCVQGWATNTYISHNEVRRAGIVNTNAGEIILYENLGYQYNGTVASATADTVVLNTSDKNKITVGSIISINNGKGRGQYRKVIKRAKETVTIDKPWDIIPDATSHVTVNLAYYNAFVCYNKLDGHTNWAEVPSSTCGLQAYGSVHNMFYSHNDIKNMNSGIDFTPYYYDNASAGQEDDAKAVIAWSQFDRNIIQDCARGIAIAMVVSKSTEAMPCEMSFGNAFRKNTISNISDYTRSDSVGSGGIGIRVGSTEANWKGNWFTGNLFESNNFKGCTKNNIILGERQGKNILRNNTQDSKTFNITVQPGSERAVEPAY